MSAHGTLHSHDGRHTVTFERELSQPIDVVWSAITEPDHLEHWFPTTIDGERAAGAHVDFRFRDVEHSKWDFDGTITEFRPPHVFGLRWGDQDVRLELTANGGSTHLQFTTTFDDAAIVARDSSGWHVCLDALVAHLAGERRHGARHRDHPRDRGLRRRLPRAVRRRVRRPDRHA